MRDSSDLNTRQFPASDLTASDVIVCDGKFFARGGRRFPVRGVTYGTFMPRDDGEPYPSRARMKHDFAAMNEAGFTVVRTYVPPPDDLVELASDWDLHVFAGFHFDWTVLLGGSRRQVASTLRDARRDLGLLTGRLAEVDTIFGISVGNEIPAEVVRWVGTRRVAGIVRDLVATGRDTDPHRLFTYANYPTAEYLPLDSLDFLTFNVFLEHRNDLHRYLNHLQHIAGERPLVLGEIGLHVADDADAEARQAGFVDWQLETALQRGVAGTCLFSWTDDWAVRGQPVDEWRFGLTRADRSARPALDVARQWNAMTVVDLRDEWPTVTVVICAYNAASTIDECLAHTCRLDYPGLEVIVVDDGSTDETGSIVRRYPRARLVQIAHAGLGVARNEGWRRANGEIVAYLDSDAYPSPEWPYYLALGFDRPTIGAVGGPNVPPPAGPVVAQQVARSPGGPVQVLLDDDRAEHVPGCNVAVRKTVLTEVGGFDPVYTSAGDDVDLCWKVLDRGSEIGFHPSAFVWHHPRATVRGYLRQQRGYGRSEALVEARHPDRFTALGTARWRGVIYNSLLPLLGRYRVYRGAFGAAAYQSVYRGGGHGLDIAHQLGVPASAAALATAPLAALEPSLGIPAAVAAVFLLVLAGIDASRATPPPRLRSGRVRFRIGVAALHLLQPLARSWGRMRHGAVARREVLRPGNLPTAVGSRWWGTVRLPDAGPRSEAMSMVVAMLRQAGLRVAATTGWEDHDGAITGSVLLEGRLVSVGWPGGSILVRVRPRLRVRPAVMLVGAAVAGAWLGPPLAMAGVAALVADAGIGLWRIGPRARAALRGGSP